MQDKLNPIMTDACAGPADAARAGSETTASSGRHDERAGGRTKTSELASWLDGMREQLARKDMQAAIGRLAGGVAHEVGNPASYLGLNLRMLQEYVDELAQILDAYAALEPLVPDLHPARQRLQQLQGRHDVEFLLDDMPRLIAESQAGIDRVANIARDLTQFARDGLQSAWSWEQADAHAILDTAICQLRKRFPHCPGITRSYGTLTPIECHPAQLQQVFAQLFDHAMHAGGHGAIAVRTCGVEAGCIRIDIAWDGGGAASTAASSTPHATGRACAASDPRSAAGLDLAREILRWHGGQLEAIAVLGGTWGWRLRLPVRQDASNG